MQIIGSIKAGTEAVARGDGAVPEEAGSTMRLSDLPRGEEGDVVAIGEALEGLQRRRLLELGIMPGARIRHELAAPLGGTMGFRICGTIIGLRREQAEQIEVRPSDS